MSGTIDIKDVLVTKSNCKLEIIFNGFREEGSFQYVTATRTINLPMTFTGNSYDLDAITFIDSDFTTV